MNGLGTLQQQNGLKYFILIHVSCIFYYFVQWPTIVLPTAAFEILV